MVRCHVSLLLAFSNQVIFSGRILRCVGGRKVGKEGLCDHLGWLQRGKGDRSTFPVTELGLRQEQLELRSSRRGVCLPSTYLLPWGGQPFGLTGSVFRGWKME